MSELSGPWLHLVAWTGDRLVAPLLSLLRLSSAAADTREIAESVIIAAIQIGVIALVFRPLEWWRPAERWTDRSLTRVDRQYTLIMVLGALPLGIFLAMTPLGRLFGGDAGAGGDSSTGLKHWLPGLDHHPVLLFLGYYLIYDFVYYWMHRAQHAIPWWWALHSLHHSQRQLSCWSNDRDCFLDGFLEAMILASVGLAIGVAPAEFALLMLTGELIQNFSHANVRIGFGSVIDKLVVGPDFHRLHHMRVDPGRPNLHNSNFAQAFPLWDILFGTALYGEPRRPTGVSDPVIDADNGRGLIGQQRSALRRFWGAFRRREGWKPGDVAFGADFAPVAAGQARPL